MFKTFTDLANSPLGEEDSEIEKILIELDVKFGTSKIGIRDIKKILSFVHEAHHTMKDTRESHLVTSMIYPGRKLGKNKTNNIMSISKTTHRAISGYYSSVQPFTNGMIVRNWLAGQSFSAQYEFGINVIKMFM